MGKASEEETLKSAMCPTADANAFRSDRHAIFKMSRSIPGWCCSSVGQVVIGRGVQSPGSVPVIRQAGSASRQGMSDKALKNTQVYNWPDRLQGPNAAIVSHNSRGPCPNTIQKKKPELVMSPGFSVIRILEAYCTDRLIGVRSSITPSQPSTSRLPIGCL